MVEGIGEGGVAVAAGEVDGDHEVDFESALHELQEGALAAERSLVDGQRERGVQRERLLHRLQQLAQRAAVGAGEHVIAAGLVEEDLQQQRTVLGVRRGAGEDVVGVAEDGEVDRELAPAAVGDFGLEHGRGPGRLADIWVKEGEKEGKGYWRCGGIGVRRDRSCGIGRRCRRPTPLSLRISPSPRREIWSPV